MTSSTTDRRLGLNGGTAIKAPCLAATTANITLSGEQTIDGVSCITGDRILVKDQTDQTTNGIYVVSTSAWTRDIDFDGNLDVVHGTLVTVLSGTSNINTCWKITTSDPITIDSSNISFSKAVLSDSSLVNFLQSGTGAVATDLQTRGRLVVHAWDYMSSAQKADAIAGTLLVDIAPAVQLAANAAPIVILPAYDMLFATSVNPPNTTTIFIGQGGFQNTATGRRTYIEYTPTTGWAFDYSSPTDSTHFYGEFGFENMYIACPNLNDWITGGAIKIGDSNHANFSTMATVGRVWTKNVFLTGNSYQGVGIYLLKCFDYSCENTYSAGFAFGAWLYGSDVGKIGNGCRFIANGVNVRSSVNGSYGGKTKLEHMDLLQSKFCSIWLDGAISAKLIDNYIENVDPTAVETAQTGTVSAGLSTTVTGSGTTFLTQLAQASFGGNRLCVLIKVGSEYRQVTAVASDTSLTIDCPFQSSPSGAAWSIIYGTGVIASSVSHLVSRGNTIDVTGASGTVPRMYLFSSGEHQIDDVAGDNALNGPVVVASVTPGALVEVGGGNVKYGLNSYQAGLYDFVYGSDSSRKRSLIQDIITADTVRPGIVYDARFWFEQDGGGKLIAPIGTGANANGMPVIYVITAGSSGDVSAALPAKLLDKKIRIKARIKEVTAGTGTMTIYKGATLGATTTSLGTFALASASNWADVDVSITGPTTADPYITFSKDTTLFQWEYVAIHAILDGDCLSSGTFTAANAATTTITDANIFSDSTVQIFPTNAAAATLMAGTSSFYISTRTAGTSFVLSTADGGSAAGTETFEYRIFA